MSDATTTGMSPAEVPPRLLTLREILEDSWHIFSTARRHLILICLMTVAIPELLFALVFAELGSVRAQTLRSLFTSSPAAGSNISQFAEPLVQFVGFFLFGLALLFVLSLFGYYLIIKICYLARRGVLVPSMRDEIAAMGLLTLRTALPLMLIMLLIGLAHAVLLAAGIFIAILALMAPVLIITEQRRPWRAFRDSLTIRYAATSPYRGWAVVIPLLSLGSASYALLWGMQEVARLLTDLDLWLPIQQATWHLQLFDRPYGIPFLASKAVELLGSLLTGLFIPIVTVAIYGRVTDTRIEIAV